MSGIIVIIIRILFTLIVYTFLGWSIFTLFKEIQDKAITISSRTIPELHIVSSDAESEEIDQVFVTPEITVGRGESCDLILSDETISTVHAKLSYHHKQWWIQDMQSTNGSFLNDDRLYTATVIISGDEIRFGQVSMQINIGS
ncbi:MAG: FHA domain-containing protein [Anaerolineaceae bacterium]|nr:FHA domain-containing protein [Anaerolineaceae bacterium]